jgi:hypothetical protein
LTKNKYYFFSKNEFLFKIWNYNLFPSSIVITYSKGRRGREAFSIHPSRHPSMNGIIQGRKPWQK